MLRSIFILLFSITLFQCEKEIIVPDETQMRNSERRLLRALNKPIHKNKKKLTIEVSNTYWNATIGLINIAVPPDPPDFQPFKTIEEAPIAQVGISRISLPDMILFGYNDYINNYPLTRKFKYISSNQSNIPDPIQTPNDDNMFYLFPDNRIDRINVLVGPDQTDAFITMQSFVNGKYKIGDLLMVQFLEPFIEDSDLLKASHFQWTETLIHCNEISYVSLIDKVQTEDFKISSLTYNFDSLIPKTAEFNYDNQADLPITLIRSSIFGEFRTDNFNPSVFITKHTKNPNIVDIPLRTNTQNLSIHIPMSFGVIKHKLYFYINKINK